MKSTDIMRFMCLLGNSMLRGVDHIFKFKRFVRVRCLESRTPTRRQQGVLGKWIPHKKATSFVVAAERCLETISVAALWMKGS